MRIRRRGGAQEHQQHESRRAHRHDPIAEAADEPAHARADHRIKQRRHAADFAVYPLIVVIMGEHPRIDIRALRLEKEAQQWIAHRENRHVSGMEIDDQRERIDHKHAGNEHALVGLISVAHAAEDHRAHERAHKKTRQQQADGRIAHAAAEHIGRGKGDKRGMETPERDFQRRKERKVFSIHRIRFLLSQMN